MKEEYNYIKCWCENGGESWFQRWTTKEAAKAHLAISHVEHDYTPSGSSVYEYVMWHEVRLTPPPLTVAQFTATQPPSPPQSRSPQENTLGSTSQEPKLLLP